VEGNSEYFFLRELKYISLSKVGIRNRDCLDSSYSKAKLKVFFPPLEGGKEGGGLL